MKTARDLLRRITAGAIAGGRSVLGACVGFAARRPQVVLVLALVVTVATLPYTIRHLGVHTDTADMFSKDVPFRQRDDEFRTLFPQFTDTLLVVIDAPSARESRAVAETLATRLRAEPDSFRHVDYRAGDPFFERHGLLYLDVATLETLAEHVRRAAPLLGMVASDPTLLGFARLLTGAMLAGGDVAPLLDRVSAALDARSVAALDWESLLAGDDGPGNGASDSAVAAGTRQILIVQPHTDFASLSAAGDSIRRVRALAREVTATSGDPKNARVWLTGEIALAHDELESSRAGALLSSILSFVLVGGLLWFALRSSRMVIAALGTLVIGLVWTACFAALAVGHVNLISIAFAVLYISLGIDYSIHLCLRYREFVGGGAGHEEALVHAVSDVGEALLLAAITTALGFLAFVPTSFLGVAEMGIIASAGLLISLVANLTILPAFLSWAPLRFRPGPNSPMDARWRSMATVAPGRRIFGAIARHRALVGAGAVAVALASAALMPWLRFDSNPINLRDPAAESVIAHHELARDSATTPDRVSVLVSDAAEAARMRAVLAALEPVGRITSLDDFVPAEQERKRAILADLSGALGSAATTPDAARVAASPEATLEALRDLREVAARRPSGSSPGEPATLARNVERIISELEAMSPDARAARIAQIETLLLGGLPPLLERLRAASSAGVVDRVSLPAAVRADYVAADGRERLDVAPRADLRDSKELVRFVDTVEAVAPGVTGGATIMAGAGRAAVAAFREASLYASAGIVVLLFLVLRRPADVVRVLVPLVLGGAATLAFIVLSGGSLNFANIIALPLLLGIGVDSGVHVVLRERDMAAGGSILETSTARAVFFSAVTNAIGFSTLVLSPHPGTASLGLVLTLGITFTLLATLMVLPALLPVRRRPAGDGAMPPPPPPAASVRAPARART